MKTFKYGILFFTILASLSSCKNDKEDDDLLDPNLENVAINEGKCGLADSTVLKADQNTDIGWVIVAPDGDFLKITYRITDEDWILKETHLSVKAEKRLIPQDASGNPKPANFEYTMLHDPLVSEYSYSANVSGLEYAFIAAHATVLSKAGETCLETLTDLQARIPQNIVNTSIVLSRLNSLYSLTMSNAGDFSKTYPAWCVDNNGQPAAFTNARLVYSYSTTHNLGLVVPNPGNLDLLNYMVNASYPDKSYQVIQAATWRLMNGSFSNGSGGINLTSEQITQYEAVISDALKNGEGFIPQCGQWVVILVDSGDRITHQNIFFIEKRKSIYNWNEGEAAWGDGSKFNTSSWDMYFEFCLNN